MKAKEKCHGERVETRSSQTLSQQNVQLQNTGNLASVYFPRVEASFTRMMYTICISDNRVCRYVKLFYLI